MLVFEDLMAVTPLSGEVVTSVPEIILLLEVVMEVDAVVEDSVTMVGCFQGST